MVDHFQILQELRKLNVDDFDLACRLSDEVNATLRALEDGVSAVLMGNVMDDVPGRTSNSVALQGSAYLEQVASFAKCDWSGPPPAYREVDPLIVAQYDEELGARITIPSELQPVDIADAARAVGEDIAILWHKHRASLEMFAACEVNPRKPGRPRQAGDVERAIAQTVYWVMESRSQPAIQFHTPHFDDHVPGKRTPRGKMEPSSVLAKVAVAVFQATDSKLDAASIKDLLMKYRKSLQGAKSQRFCLLKFDIKAGPEDTTKISYNVVTALKKGGAVLRRHTKQ